MTYRFITRIIIPIISLMVATLLHHFLVRLASFDNTQEILLIIFIVVVSLFFQQLLLWLLEKNAKVDCKSILLDTERKKNAEARRGLLVFLSLYSLTQDGKEKWKKSYGYYPDDDKERFNNDVNKMNENKDYKGMLIDEPGLTNFGTTTKAIITHLNKLQSLWIISTESKNDPKNGSKKYRDTYLVYLQDTINKEQEIHINAYNTISVDEDSKIVEETSNLLSRIYKLAKKRGISSKEIIVDVTPGTVSMTTGAVLGSIGRERDIEIMVGHHDPNQGLLKMKDPVIIKYQTILPRESE